MNLWLIMGAGIVFPMIYLFTMLLIKRPEKMIYSALVWLVSVILLLVVWIYISFCSMNVSQFYRIPKTLYSAECFKDVSFAAKAIYGMMIDRVGLSIKNQWLDEEGKTYICYSIEEIMEDSNCKRSSVIKVLEQLREVGLIEL